MVSECTLLRTLRIVRGSELTVQDDMLVSPEFLSSEKSNSWLPSWNISGKFQENAEILVRYGSSEEWGSWRGKFELLSWYEGKTIPSDQRSSEIASPTRYQLAFRGLAPEQIQSIGVSCYGPSPRFIRDSLPEVRGCELRLWPVCQRSQEGGNFPYRKDGKVGNLICAPSSLKMLLDYVTPFEWGYCLEVLAGHVFDPTTNLYGVHALNARMIRHLSACECFLVCQASMEDLERQILARCPVVVSLAWQDWELTNGSQERTSGHLVVVSGFTQEGDVIVMDPNCMESHEVRRVLNRFEFFHAWRARNCLAYIVRRPE